MTQPINPSSPAANLPEHFFHLEPVSNQIFNLNALTEFIPGYSYLINWYWAPKTLPYGHKVDLNDVHKA